MLPSLSLPAREVYFGPHWSELSWHNAAELSRSTRKVEGLKPGPHRTRQRCVPTLFATVRARPGPFRSVPPRQNRLQHRRRRLPGGGTELASTGRKGSERARTVANRVGTALTGAVRTGLRTLTCGQSTAGLVKLGWCRSWLSSARPVPEMAQLSPVRCRSWLSPARPVPELAQPSPVCAGAAGREARLRQPRRPSRSGATLSLHGPGYTYTSTGPTAGHLGHGQPVLQLGSTAPLDELPSCRAAEL